MMNETWSEVEIVVTDQEVVSLPPELEAETPADTDLQEAAEAEVAATQPVHEIFEEDEDTPEDEVEVEERPVLYANLPAPKAAAVVVEATVEVVYTPQLEPAKLNLATTPKDTEKEDAKKENEEEPTEEVVAVEEETKPSDEPKKAEDKPADDVSETDELPTVAAGGDGQEPPKDEITTLGGDDWSERPEDGGDESPATQETNEAEPASTTEIPEQEETPENEETETPATRPADFETISEGRPHDNARHEINAKLERKAKEEMGLETVERYPVPDDRVNWQAEYPDYHPQFVDLPHNDTSFNPETNQDDPSRIESFQSLAVEEVQRDEAGRPLNPMGRTGIQGRGVLAKWGPTEAADVILTRDNPETGQLEVLLIERRDTGEWAIPGGKRDPGEAVWETAGRELIEEAGVEGIDTDFSNDPVVYAGYIDDSRNTDNAWMESTAFHRHLAVEKARSVTVQAGSDAAAARWTPVTNELYSTMFGSHGPILKLAVGDSPA